MNNTHILLSNPHTLLFLANTLNRPQTWQAKMQKWERNSFHFHTPGYSIARSLLMFPPHRRPPPSILFYTNTLCTSTAQWHVRIFSYCYTHTMYTYQIYMYAIHTTHMLMFRQYTLCSLVFGFFLSFSRHAFQRLKFAALSDITISFTPPL